MLFLMNNISQAGGDLKRTRSWSSSSSFQSSLLPREASSCLYMFEQRVDAAEEKTRQETFKCVVMVLGPSQWIIYHVDHSPI